MAAGRDMENGSRFDLDTRTAKEIQKEIAATARSYTPEWKFDSTNPDVGSVIGLLFAGQMEDTIRKMNLLPEKYRVEFVNLFGISLQSAKPAKTIVVIQISSRANGEVQVPRGTQLLGESEQGQEIIFETVYDICVTPVKLTSILGISGEHCKIISYRDEDSHIRYPISLFAYEEEGIRNQSLMLYHSSLYDTDTTEIRIRFTGNKQAVELAELFTAPDQFRFSYQREEGMTAFEKVEIMDDIILLKPEHKMTFVIEQGREYYRIQLDMLQQVKEPIELSRVELLPIEGKAKAHYISNGAVEMKTELFYPFGEQLAVYNECYIGEDIVFSKIGAEVTLCFDLEFKINDFTFFEEEKKESLPIVKRKPKKMLSSSHAVCSVQEVAIEYYNGIGWKQLTCLQRSEHLFASVENSGIQVMRFLVPKDWEPMQIGGYEERCLRIMVTKADNCYRRPSTHVCPLVKNLNITYRYTQKYLQPECLKRMVGTTEIDLTRYLMEQHSFLGFSQFPYTNNFMYFGFNKKFEGGPISLFFNLREGGNTERISLGFEYASPTGFKPLQVIDHTRQLSNKGTILFWPPVDMAQITVEGEEGYFIRIMQAQGSGWKHASYPILEEVQMNGVDVENVEKQEMQEYTMEVVEPNMSFPLYATNILEADVWVNERGTIPVEQMKQMLRETPEQVEAICNVYGEIEEFYVQWSEVENFDSSVPTDRHYRMDRLYHKILFGDGIAVKIPKNIQGIAFKVALRYCSGALGNVGVGRIHDFRRSRILVDEVTNPINAYGGSMPEDEEDSLQRGSNLLSAGKRLVTELDYIREIKAFSNHIDKVSCSSTELFSPKEEEGGICIILLMKEYKQGSYSFYDVKKSLRQQLVLQCEMTCTEEVRMIEPTFVHISVEVWLMVADITETFHIQKTWQEQLEEYLEPISGNGRNGWEIGTLPTESQIHMVLRGMEQSTYKDRSPLEKGSSAEQHFVSIEHYSIHAVYRDASGAHDMILQEVPKSPLMIGCNGTHRIHTTVKKGEPYAKQ